jgi:hypothetical protein
MKFWAGLMVFMALVSAACVGEGSKDETFKSAVDASGFLILEEGWLPKPTGSGSDRYTILAGNEPFIEFQSKVAVFLRHAGWDVRDELTGLDIGFVAIQGSRCIGFGSLSEDTPLNQFMRFRLSRQSDVLDQAAEYKTTVYVSEGCG